MIGFYCASLYVIDGSSLHSKFAVIDVWGHGSKIGLLFFCRVQALERRFKTLDAQILTTLQVSLRSKCLAWDLKPASPGAQDHCLVSTDSVLNWVDFCPQLGRRRKLRKTPLVPGTPKRAGPTWTSSAFKLKEIEEQGRKTK